MPAAICNSVATMMSFHANRNTETIRTTRAHTKKGKNRGSAAELLTNGGVDVLGDALSDGGQVHGAVDYGGVAGDDVIADGHGKGLAGSAPGHLDHNLVCSRHLSAHPCCRGCPCSTKEDQIGDTDRCMGESRGKDMSWSVGKPSVQTGDAWNAIDDLHELSITLMTALLLHVLVALAGFAVWPAAEHTHYSHHLQDQLRFL